MSGSSSFSALRPNSQRFGTGNFFHSPEQRIYSAEQGTAANAKLRTWSARKDTGLMSRPLVSVLINNYNYRDYIAQAIDSAIAQDYQPLEVIVVDDGSTDDSRSLISRYGSQIRAIFQDNGGQASAFNAGVSAARGDILCFLDADDYWRPDKVTKVVDVYAGLEQLGPLLVHHRLAIQDSSTGATDDRLFGALHKSPLNLVSYAVKYKCLPYEGSATSGMSMNRSLAKMLFPLPEKHIRACADDLVVRAASLVAALYSIEPVLGTYRVHGANLWFSTDRRMSPEFLATRDSYLNQKLAENNIAGTLSYYDSMDSWWDLVKDKRWLELLYKMTKAGVMQHDKHTLGRTYWVARYALETRGIYQRAGAVGSKLRGLAAPSSDRSTANK
jgi:glycosyltransferase involved in cell wall biosynthesis